MSLQPKLKHYSREHKAELYSLLLERKRREVRDNAFDSYAGFVSHFSEEPDPARHHKYLIEKLEQVAKGEITRLMIFMPPGTAKSTYTSVLYPPYWLEKNPNKLIIGTSHDGRLAAKFGRKVRNIVGGDEYRKVFGTVLKQDSRAADQWETDKDSEYYAVGVGGSITGRRGHFGLIDDPVKGKKEAMSENIQNDTYEWYKSDFRTRLLPGAPIIIIQTRWVEYDLSGRILPEDYDGRSGPVVSRDGSEVWEVINLPMEAIEGDVLGRKKNELLWPELYDKKWCKAEKKIQGKNWNALYQQNPAPDEGDYYKREDFNWYDAKKLPKHLTNYIAGDYAVTDADAENASPDFTEIYNFAVCPSDRIYLTACIKEMAELNDWVPKYIKMIKRWKPVKAIGETGVIRRAVEAMIKREMREQKAYASLEWLPHNQGDKAAMGRSFQALVQQGLVYLPEGEQWAQDLVDQLCKFPNGAYDDGADACALFGRWIDKVWSKKVKKDKAKKVEVKGMQPMTIGDLHSDD
jgi:predicted phage terminase large subunit-like protein